MDTQQVLDTIQNILDRLEKIEKKVFPTLSMECIDLSAFTPYPIPDCPRHPYPLYTGAPVEYKYTHELFETLSDDPYEDSSDKSSQEGW